MKTPKLNIDYVMVGSDMYDFTGTMVVKQYFSKIDGVVSADVKNYGKGLMVTTFGFNSDKISRDNLISQIREFSQNESILVDIDS